MSFEDWTNMKIFMEILEPLYEFTVEICSEKMTTLSKVIPIINNLKSFYGNNENYDKENNDGKNDDNVSKVLRVPEALLLIAPACYYSQTQLLTPTKHKSLNYKSMQENTSRTEHEPLIIKPNTNSTRAF